MSKIILVTGSSSGIGHAIASHLASVGHRVYGTSRSQSSKRPSEGFELIKMDVTNAEEVQEGIEAIVTLEGRLDVLINNAGLGMAGPLENTSDEEARLIFDTNVFGVLNTCRFASSHLRASKGYVINVTSLGGVFGLPYRGIYCASKFAVEGISEVMSMEMKPHGVKVVIIEPGDFKTNINRNRLNAQNVDMETYPDFQVVLNQIHQEVKGALDPHLIAKRVESILATSNPKLRYRVATPLQRFSVYLKRFLPGRRFERMLSKHYSLSDNSKE